MKRDFSIQLLETSANTRHSRLEWRMERVGWGAMLLILIAAVVGLLGPGPLSVRNLSLGDGSLALEYNSIEHYEAPGCLVIRARPADGAVRLAISRSFCDHTTAESIIPSPVSVEVGDDVVVHTFAVPSSVPAVVIYRYKYGDFAVFDHHIAVDDGARIAFRQYVLP